MHSFYEIFFISFSILNVIGISTQSNILSNTWNATCPFNTICKLPSDIKLNNQIVSDDNNIIGTKTPTHWNAILNNTLKSLGINYDSKLCNLEIKYQTGSDSQYIIIPSKNNYLNFYLHSLLKYELSKERNCNEKLLLKIPTKILVWPILKVNKKKIPTTTTTKASLPNFPKSTTTHGPTRTSKAKSSSKGDNTTLHYTDIHLDLNDITPTHYFLNNKNVDKLMADAKYRHYLNN